MYTFAEHSHRFAAWSAATAAMRSPSCRFKVMQGREIIEATALHRWGQGWSWLPQPGSFNAQHRELRDAVVEVARSVISEDYRYGFTHGVAAKLINMYLKAIYLSGPVNQLDRLSQPELAKANAIHPPIDTQVLLRLRKLPRGRVLPTCGWSMLSSKNYEAVLRVVKAEFPDGLWRMEMLWSGYR